jgi:Zn-dependent protease
MHIHKKSIFPGRFFEICLMLLSGLFWILALFGFDEPAVAFITLIAVAIHEFGHEAMLFILKKPLRLPLPRANGFKIKPHALLSYKEEIAVLVAGPFANLIFALLALPFLSKYESLQLFSVINGLTALTNLIPVRGYDGYKILSATAEHFECSTLNRVLDVCSLLFASAVLLLSLYAIDRLDAGYWIFGVFFIFLLREVKNSI